MVNKLSIYVTNILVDKGKIIKEDYELYHYGLFILISEILLFMYCLLVGAVFKNILPSILFYMFFSLVHRFSGGFHAKTELHCLIITLSFFLISIILIKLSTQLNCITLIAFYVCSIILIILSPADTPQKPLSNKEKILFKKMTSLIIVVGFIVIVALFVKNIYLYANAIVIAVFLQTLSIICGRLFNKRLLTNK